MPTILTADGQKLVPVDHKALMFARSRRGWSQYHVARLAGISRSYLSEVERGKKTPRYLVVKAIAEALEVPMDEITV
jgi:transcriptional regulator with XRE-family HTH domain